jgi:hypothetical protein
METGISRTPLGRTFVKSDDESVDPSRTEAASGFWQVNRVSLSEQAQSYRSSTRPSTSGWRHRWRTLGNVAAVGGK